MSNPATPVVVSTQPTTPTRTKRKPGRQSKATPERLAKFRSLVESGLSLKGAAHACGLSESVIYRWRAEDPAIEELVQSALAESERQLVDLALEGARKDGRIALMMLERRFGDSWCKRSQHEHLHAHADAGVLALLVKSRKERDARLACETVTVDAEVLEDDEDSLTA